MADITPGYIFASGEKNVNHTKLNNSAAGTVNTTFHTGKASAGSNPNVNTTELIVYDGTTFKKGTLSSLFLDHTGLLSARTAKTVPVAADALLLADSAASNAYKQITLANLLFGAAAHTAPIAADKLAIYDSAGTEVKSITLANLINQAVAHTAPVTADALILRENGGAFRKMTLGNLVNGATALTTAAGTNAVPIYDGDYKKITLSDLATYFRQQAVQGYVLVQHEVASGTDGGTFTSGAWQTRPLNTEVADVSGICTLAANQVTLSAGTYVFRGEAPASSCSFHKLRLHNATDNTTIQYGRSMFCTLGGVGYNTAIVVGRFTIAASKALELQHRCNTTVATTGMGAAGSLGGNEVYATLEFWRES